MLRQSGLTLSQGISNTYRAIGHGAGQIWWGIGHGVRTTLRAIGNAIANTLRAIGNAIANTLRAIGNAIANTLRAIRNAIVNTLQAIGNAIVNTLRAVGNAITITLRAIRNAIVNTLRAGGNAILNTLRAIVNAITNTLRAVGDGIVSVVRSTGQAIVHAFSAVNQGIIGFGGQIRRKFNRLIFRFRRTTLTLSIDQDRVRAVVFKGNQVVAWNTAVLEGAAASEEDGEAVTPEPHESVPTGEEGEEPARERPAVLNELVEELQARRARLVIDLPLYAPLIRHVRLPRMRGRHLERMILGEVLNTVPFQEEEVDISWHLRKDAAGQEAFAIAVPRGSIDSQVQMVEETNRSPAASYTRATALAFAAGAPNAVVVQIEAERVATVLVHRSTPQVVNQQEFAWDEANAQDQADAVAMAVDQVSGYYRTLGAEDESESLPVVLIGPLAAASQALTLLPQVLGRQVLPFAPVVNCPDDFPQDQYATNLGLFLADQARAKAWDNSTEAIGPALNVLPARYRPRPVPVFPIAVFVGLSLLVALAVFIAGPVSDATGKADRLSTTLEELKTTEQELFDPQGELRGQTAELLEAAQEVASLRFGLGELEVNVGSLLDRLTAITEETPPEDLELSSVAPGETGFTLAGRANSYNAVLEYVRNLRASEQFERVEVGPLTGPSQTSVNFIIIAYIPQPAGDEESGEENQP